MQKFHQVLDQIGGVVRGLLKVVPTRILLGVVGAMLAGISAKHPDWPMPTATELLAIIGVLVAADTVRPIGSATTKPAVWPEARALSEALGAGKPKDSMEGK